jgi:hypothetical protein
MKWSPSSRRWGRILLKSEAKGLGEPEQSPGEGLSGRRWSKKLETKGETSCVKLS